MDIPEDFLDELDEFLDDYSDAEYGPDGVPRGNRAMHMLGELRRLRGQAE